MRKKEKELLKTICENKDVRKFIIMKSAMFVPIFSLAFVGTLGLFEEPFALQDVVIGILAAVYILWFFIELIISFCVVGNVNNEK